jgi:cytochrome c oxidase cbb3-type subunit 3
MPAWQAVLGDEGVQQVADYVLSLSRGGGGSTDATPSAGQGPYSTYCSACHGPDGSGQPALGAPALDDDDWLYGGSAAEVRASIANGRNGVMPAFGGRLDTAQIKMLVAWLSRDRETSSELAARR